MMSKRVLIKRAIVPAALLLLYFVIVMKLRSGNLYVYGKFAESFRPYRIDDDTFFFLTESHDEAYPVIYRAENGGFFLPSENFERKNKRLRQI